VVRVPLAVLGGVVSGVVALLAGGCDPTPKPAPPIKVSPSASVDPKAKVEADYLAYWSALKAAHEASNPSYPDLKKHASGKGLKDSADAVDSLHSVDMVLRGTVAHTIDIASVSDTTAMVHDCLDTKGWNYYDSKTNKLHSPQPAKVKLKSDYELQLSNGTWMVTAIRPNGHC
jgi:hypothetical protein